MVEQLPRFAVINLHLDGAAHEAHPSTETEGVEGLDGDTVVAAGLDALGTALLDKLLLDALVEGHEERAAGQVVGSSELLDAREDREGLAAAGLRIDHDGLDTTDDCFDDCGLERGESRHCAAPG